MSAPSFDKLPDISIGPIETNWYLDDQFRPVVRSSVTAMRDCYPFTDEEIPLVELAIRELLTTHDYQMEVIRGEGSAICGYIDFEVIQWKE